MDPVTGGLIAANVLGGLAQAYQAEKAGRANARELKRLEEAFNNIKPPNYNFSVMDPPELIKENPPPPQYDRNGTPLPSFDMTKMTPKEYSVVQQYVPEVAPVIAEQAPELVKQTETAKEGRSAQLEALRRFRQISESGGEDPTLKAGLDEAARRTQAEAQSRQQSILQDAARRGQMGSGTMLAAQLAGGEAAMTRSAEAGRASALEAYRNRLNALREGASLGGQVAQDENAMSQTNTDIINRFNERMGMRAQQQANMAADIRNRGRLTNIEMGQSAADRNVGTANEFMRADRDRQDRLKMSLYDKAEEARRYGNELEAREYERKAGEIERQNRTTLATDAIRRGERDRQDRLAQSQYGYEADKADRAAQIAGLRMGQNTQRAQNRAAQTQAVTNAATAGLQYYGGQQAQDRAGRQQYARDSYQRTGQLPSDEEMQKYDDFQEKY